VHHRKNRHERSGRESAFFNLVCRMLRPARLFSWGTFSPRVQAALGHDLAAHGRWPRSVARSNDMCANAPSWRAALAVSLPHLISASQTGRLLLSKSTSGG